MRYKTLPLISRRGVLVAGAGLIASVAGFPAARGQELVRIGLATRTWFPSVVAQTAVDQGLFEKEGLQAELTIYQSGAEAFTAMTAGAADIIASSPAQVANGRKRGVDARIVGSYTKGNYGWHLMVAADSAIDDVSQLDGSQVGITTAGSLSDALAQWAMENTGVQFTTIPLGGAGLVPNLIAGNVDAAVIYSPLSFQVLQDGDGRSILDFGTAMPEHLNSGWAATEQFIAERRELLQKSLNALYGGVVFLQENRDEAVRIISEINDIRESVAVQEYDEVFLNLLPDGYMDLELAETALELARSAGFTDYTEADQIYTDEVTPVPTPA